MDTFNSLKILVVEDDAGDVLLLKEALKHAYSNFEFWHASTVTAAHEVLQQSRPDVVILDLSLPDGVGVEVVQKMHACAMQIPIVVLTGREDEALALICIDAGAQDFMSKSSLKSVALRRSIGYALSRQHEERSRGLETDLACYKHFLSDIEPAYSKPETRAFASFSEANPLKFQELQAGFTSTLELYLDHLISKSAKPLQEMLALTTKLANLGAGSKDIIALQMASMNDVTGSKNTLRAHDYSKDARLFALELMALLVEYYRYGLDTMGST